MAASDSQYQKVSNNVVDDDTLPDRFGADANHNVDLSQIPYLPKLKSQGEWGTCYAFAATALAEINMWKQGYADPSTVDYSELGLISMNHLRANGGDALGALETLTMQGLGFVDEATVPYSNIEAYDDGNYMPTLEDSQQVSADIVLVGTKEEGCLVFFCVV